MIGRVICSLCLITAEERKRGCCSVSAEEGKKLPAKGARAKASSIGSVHPKNVKASSHEATGSQFSGYRRPNTRRVI